ncbi:porin family protein [Pollutibacter soli]|uniref:porin family protein n=1 Tax=Pollutibacter soli TaxID=3034157 RepID=UPI0030136EC9
MRKMVVNSLAIFLTVNNSIAQNTAYGIQGGLVISNISCNAETSHGHTTYLTGFSGGVYTDLQFSGHLSFQPGLNFTTKGGYEKTSDTIGELRIRTRTNYIEFPFNLVYHFKEKQSGFFTGVGLSLAFGLTGKIDYDCKENSNVCTDRSEKVKYGLSETDHFKSLDCGLNMIAGYGFRCGVTMNVTYCLGLANIATLEGLRKTNTYFALKIGFLLRQKH